MIQTIQAKNRHFSDFGWLKTYWLFSFSEYYDPKNIQFGNLRVFNDDEVQPQSGFPQHSHSNMEIISIVRSGEITHKDNMGNESVIGPGDIQVMSAGAGITHSESNLGKIPAHFYQIWITPKENNIKPKYEQKNFIIIKNSLTSVASGRKIPNTLPIHSDATIYLGSLDNENTIMCSTKSSHGTFIYLTFGKIQLNKNILSQNDQAKITNEETLEIKALEDSRFILIDTHI